MRISLCIITTNFDCLDFFFLLWKAPFNDCLSTYLFSKMRNGNYENAHPSFVFSLERYKMGHFMQIL